jgi:hypothetical protein
MPGAGNESLAQAAASSQARLRPPHAAAVLRVVVVVAQEVKETMKGENTQLGGVRMAALARLPPGDARGDDNVPEKSRSAPRRRSGRP